MKRTLTVTAALALGAALLVPLAAATATPVHSPPGHGGGHGHGPTRVYNAPPLVWGTCASPRLQAAGATCAMLEVPLDHARPNGTRIKVAVSRILHTDPDYRGMIAANPGGPGGSGLGMARLGAAIPNGVGAKYDWYGFDPRGVGSSQPALTCDPNYPGQGYDRPNYVPDREGSEQWWLRTTSDYADACGSSAARALLDHVKTTDVATDLDILRRAVGADKLNYYGFSYGTYLGQVYATMYPKTVGRFVMDGVLNAKRAFYLSNVDQNVAFDENIDRYFGWLAQHDARFGLGTDADAIRSGYYDLLDKLAASPAAGGKLGPNELADSMQNAAYYVYNWVETGDAYAKLVNTGDGQELLDNFYGGPGPDNSYAMYLGVQCTDAVWPAYPKTRADAWRVHRKHPFLTWGNTWFNAPCLNWPAESRKAVKVSGERVHHQMLLIAETHDAATPFSGALATRKAFPTASLIEGVGGTTHSGSLSGVACTDNAVATFLDTGVAPKRLRGANRSDLLCDPVPAPEPAAAKAFSAGPSADAMAGELRTEIMEAQRAGR